MPPRSDERLLDDLYKRTLDSFVVDPADEALYEPLFRAHPGEDLPPDPLPELRRAIIRGGTTSVQLFSGLRGTGKTTQLKRLQLDLERRGCTVLYIDVLAYLSVTQPIDPSSFLLMVAGAASDALAEDKQALGEDARQVSYWTRFVEWLRETKVDVEGLGFKANFSTPIELGAEVKFKLHREENLREKLRSLSSAHAGSLAQSVHDYLRELAVRVRAHHHDAARSLVLIVDSFEKIYGDGSNDNNVYGAAAALFRAHVDKLRIPEWHALYTVPPWLQFGIAGTGGAYDQTYMLPCVKVRQRGQAFDADSPTEGVSRLNALITKREGEIHRLVASASQQNRLAQASGGFLRDLLRLYRECVARGEEYGLPLSDAAIDEAIENVRNGYRHLADTDVQWLHRVAASGEIELPSMDHITTLARFFDLHLVLGYRNGASWFDVHPIIAEQVMLRASTLHARDEGGRAASSEPHPADAGS